MNFEKKINRVREFLLWTYITALIAGTICALASGQEASKSFGNVIQSIQSR